MESRITDSAGVDALSQLPHVDNTAGARMLLAAAHVLVASWQVPSRLFFLPPPPSSSCRLQGRDNRRAVALPVSKLHALPRFAAVMGVLKLG